MCVIICKPADKAISDHDIKNAHRVNSDGFGYMYYDKELKDIVAKKGVFSSDVPILKMVGSLQDKEVVFHFRIKTHGEISNAACHPFRVTDKEKHGMTIYVMHNGTISGMSGKVNESDTQIFVNKYLHKILKHNPMLIEEPEFKDLIESKIGRWNKLCFMYGEGKILRFNEGEWITHESMRCSNKNFVHYSQHKSHETHKDWLAEMDAEAAMEQAYLKRSCASRSAYAPLLCGYPVAVKDTLLITHKQEDGWTSEGEITHINPFSVLVWFKDRAGVSRNLAFFLISGDSAHTDGGYQCLPMNRKVVDSEKSISDLAGPSMPLLLAPPSLADVKVEETDKKKRFDSILSHGTFRDVATRDQESRSLFLQRLVKGHHSRLQG